MTTRSNQRQRNRQMMTWEFSGSVSQKAMDIADIAANQMTTMGEDQLTNKVVDAVIDCLSAQGDESWDDDSVRAVLANCEFMPAV